jgi:predicted peptidase
LLRLVVLLAASIAAFASPARAVQDTELGRYWTDDALKVPYRAIETPGRIGDEKIALIVFLHGDWQDGTDNASQLAGYGNGSMELIDRAIAGGVPIVYAAPQTTGAYWPPERVEAVVRDALSRWPIDPKRVILTGISDGGTGVWDTLKTWPQCFAAGVPMSGMTELTGLATIRDVPQWIFHGDADNDTNVETGYGGAMVGSRAVVRELRAVGGAPVYTEYPNEQHVIWHRAYGESGLLPWMLGQRLRGKACSFAEPSR